MLKENINYGFEHTNELVGMMFGVANNIKDLIKSYMLLGIKYGKDDFDYITYRNHELYINDPEGYTDAITLEEDLRSQINEVNKIEDSKEGK